MIANILSIEQVLVCRMLLYSPHQAGYGTSCDESCLGSDGNWMIYVISCGGKISSIKTGNRTAIGESKLILLA